MSEYDDDLDTWRDDPFVQALRAPGTAAELVGEDEVLALYRSAVPRRSRRRVVGRLGIGGTAVVGAIAMSGGVAAAAYTQALPEPVQTIAHLVFGPVGVPAPHPDRPHRVVAEPSPRSAPTSSPAPSAGATAGTRPRSQPSTSPGAAVPPAVATDSSAPSPTQTPTPSGSPTPSPTTTQPVRQRVATISIAAGSRRVSAGDVVVVSGTVMSRSGHPIKDRAVRMVERPVGASAPPTVVRTRTSADGRVTLDTIPIERTTVVRLAVGKKAHSKRIRIVLVPTVSATVSGGVVTIATTGAQPGDQVKLLRRTKTGLTLLRKGRVDGAGSAVFTIHPAKKQIRCVVRLPRTPQHAFAKTVLVVEAGSRPTGGSS